MTGGQAATQPDRARAGIAGGQAAVMRCMDVPGAAAGLVLALPLLAAVAAVIWLDSLGPVFFVQERAGLHGRPFRLIKFRTMVPGAERLLDGLVDMERLEPPAFKLRDDPRVTRAGRWLRRTSLDELPQLVNVLRGQMSLVGPRPDETRLVARYTPWQRRKLSVRPGLTGPMQVGGRADLSFEERMCAELAYVDRYSLWLDVRILFKTVPAVLLANGAY